MESDYEITEKLRLPSERVKCVDIHPTEPWLLCALFTGEVTLRNYETKQLIKVFKECDLPVRTAKFIPKKNWIVAGSDDYKIRVYNYNTLEQEYAFKAHSDFIRCIIVHSTKPYILSCGDDHHIKLWNWERKFKCERTFKGHEDYVMQVVFSPGDLDYFASASLDKTLKVWNLNVSKPSFTLHGHVVGVNCVEYVSYICLVSGGDYGHIKVWSCNNKVCLKNMYIGMSNLTSICFLSLGYEDLLVIGTEDGRVELWLAGTYRNLTKIDHEFEGVWTVGRRSESKQAMLAIGCDKGAIVMDIKRNV